MRNADFCTSFGGSQSMFKCESDPPVAGHLRGMSLQSIPILFLVLLIFIFEISSICEFKFKWESVWIPTYSLEFFWLWCILYICNLGKNWTLFWELRTKFVLSILINKLFPLLQQQQQQFISTQFYSFTWQCEKKKIYIYRKKENM